MHQPTRNISNIAVVGYGSFGQLLVRLLAPHVPVKVYDKKGIEEGVLPKNATATNALADSAASDVIFIATELDSLEAVCSELKVLVSADTIVADVCSVKVKPAEIMQSILGDTCMLLATHPLFGPQTVLKPEDALGQKLVWHELTKHDFSNLRTIFEDRIGVEVVELNPEQHDREMAWVHGLTFFTGRALLDMKPPMSTLGTNYYQKLIDLVTVESQHSEELFYTIQRGNPYTDEIRQQFMDTLAEYERRIKSSNSTESSAI